MTKPDMLVIDRAPARVLSSDPRAISGVSVLAMQSMRWKSLSAYRHRFQIHLISSDDSVASNRCVPHRARNLARASRGQKGNAKIPVNCQQILQTSGSVGSLAGLTSNKQWERRVWRSLVPRLPMRLPMTAARQLSGHQVTRLIERRYRRRSNLPTRGNCYRYACRSVRLTREVARKTAARIIRRTLERGMPLTGSCT
jgi:hypothetical protein